jgi:N-acetylated-alpha-linked acidic dipeptidase
MADNQNNERTPLIAVVHYPPPPPRRRADYNHSCCRRICTTILALILLLIVTIFILFLFIVPDCDNHNRRNGHRGRNDIDICVPKHPFFRDQTAPVQTTAGVGYEDLLAILASTPNETKAREWSEYYTAGPHLAGKNLSQAEWTKDRWQEFGVPQTEIVSYEIYVNYPVGHRLALLEKGNSSKSDTASTWNVKYEAILKEDVLEDDPTTGLSDSIPTFHGYSASGNVTAPYVYVNYGTYQDFEDLKDANVTLEGKIALIKYGGIFRGLKVKRAQELGMVGAVIYSDPGDDGEVTLENGNKTYPDGPARNPSSVQRGSVQFLCRHVSLTCYGSKLII